MTLQTKIYIGLVVTAIFAAAILGGAAWSNHKIHTLEKAVEETKQIAGDKEKLAAAKELEAAGYKQKIEYLEQQLSEIQTKARKQDEKLEKLTTNNRLSRGRVERAKRTRTIPANTAELCAKLAELGHACE